MCYFCFVLLCCQHTLLNLLELTEPLKMYRTYCGTQTY